MMCYFGNDIVVESSELSASIFKSNWMAGNAENKKSIIFMMERFKRPSSISAAKMYVLTLRTFTSVSNCSFNA